MSNFPAPVIQTAAQFTTPDGRLTRYGVEVLNSLRIRSDRDFSFRNNIATASIESQSYQDITTASIDVGQRTEGMGVVALLVCNVWARRESTFTDELRFNVDFAVSIGGTVVASDTDRPVWLTETTGTRAQGYENLTFLTRIDGADLPNDGIVSMTFQGRAGSNLTTNNIDDLEVQNAHVFMMVLR